MNGNVARIPSILLSSPELETASSPATQEPCWGVGLSKVEEEWEHYFLFDLLLVEEVAKELFPISSLLGSPASKVSVRCEKE